MSGADQDTFEIAVNGEPRSAGPDTTVVQFLEAHELDPDLVVVEHNHTILPRDAFDRTLLKPGDTLEIVHFVGGG